MLKGVEVSQQQPEAGRVTQQQPLRNIAAARSEPVGPVPDALVVPDNTPQSAIAAINAGCRMWRWMAMTMSEKASESLPGTLFDYTATPP
jgi:hypothetical protein